MDGILRIKWTTWIGLSGRHVPDYAGNQGSGKSALVESIALAGNSKNFAHCSFLTAQKFKLPTDNKSRHFTVTLRWEDGTEVVKNLNDDIDDSTIETVRFIPQGMFDKICNDLNYGKSDFSREIEKVIFSHVPNEQRLNEHNLEDLINHRKDEINRSIGSIENSLSILNENIIREENKLLSSYKSELIASIEQKTKELSAHRKSKPKSKAKPLSFENQSKILADIGIEKKKLDRIQKQISKSHETLGRIARQISVIENITQGLETLDLSITHLRDQYSKDLQDLGISFDSIINVEIKETPLTSKKSQLEKIRKRETIKIDPVSDKSLLMRENLVVKKIEILGNKLDKPAQEFNKYLKGKEDWEQKGKEIIGDETTQGSLYYFKKLLSDIDNVPTTLNKLYLDRKNIVKQLFSCKQKIIDIYREFYEPIHSFIENHEIAKKKLQLNFDVRLTMDNSFVADFFSYIIQNVSGSFYGKSGGEKVLKDIILKYSFSSGNDIEKFLDEIIDSLQHNKSSEDESLLISDQLSKNVKQLDFYNFLFNIDYLIPTYILRYGTKDLTILSPGERGALLLIFYLLIDRERIPLIVDQPEGNLDNQTIYRLLVSSIIEAKNERQILIVTHNPNLAVVCDSEQVIYCEKDQTDLVIYKSGAIEDEFINRKIVDILEGTKPAFSNRSDKYD